MGQFVLAPFAPSVAWTPQKVSRLFDSLYRGWPIGEIVLWMPLAAPNQSTTAPSGEMIVDGTQRIIAIYSALRGRKPAFTATSILCLLPRIVGQNSNKQTSYGDL
jgi:hypothetical protein